jgi:hypothetical protein
MNFEHLVEINDPLMPLLDPLTREQLWRGLVRRAEDPVRFVLGLERAELLGRLALPGGGASIERLLDFGGGFQVRDRVELTPQVGSVTTVAASRHHGASRLSITIEEPQPERLYLRFVYADLPAADGASAVGADPGAPVDPLDAQVRALRDAAYRAADLDTLVAIRELAAAGALCAAA